MLLQLIYLAFLLEMMYYIMDEMTDQVYQFIILYYYMGGKWKCHKEKDHMGIKEEDHLKKPKKLQKRQKRVKRGQKRVKSGKKESKSNVFTPMF